MVERPSASERLHGRPAPQCASIWPMRAIENLFALSLLLPLVSLPLTAQQKPPAPKPVVLHFHPGQWEIDSVTTAQDGRAVSSTTDVCATEQMDFWKVVQPGLECKPPTSHRAAAGGYRVRFICTYAGPSLHSEIRSNVIEKYAHDGNSFTVDGTSTTNTVYQGVQPKQTSIQLHASAHRLGPCD